MPDFAGNIPMTLGLGLYVLTHDDPGERRNGHHAYRHQQEKTAEVRFHNENSFNRSDKKGSGIVLVHSAPLCHGPKPQGREQRSGSGTMLIWGAAPPKRVHSEPVSSLRFLRPETFWVRVSSREMYNESAADPRLRQGRCAMKPAPRFVLFGMVLLLLTAPVISRAQDNSPAQANLSHVRIVRLSFVEGTVTMQRPDLADWSAAPANTPIQEGFKLSTAEKSFAEVEFENTSTARIGQLSLLDFDQLAATASGGKVNRITLEQGYATFTVVPEGIDSFEVKALDTTVTLAAATMTRFRIDIDEGAVRVEVFKGAAEVSSPYGRRTLTSDMKAEIQPGAAIAFDVNAPITKDAWDEWVDERENQMTAVRNSPSPSNGGSYYGWNDLSNYGDWSYFPGYGYGWLPAAPYGWSPFTAGQWCWYPGFGYTWISFEPWGWLPYHFGGWLFYPGFGWAWFPGSFGGWSPGNVAWWQGQGAVGWSPLPPAAKSGMGSGVGTANCPHGQTCGRVIVRPGTVQEGRPVSTGVVNADLGSVRVVPRLDIPPAKTGMLPGAISARPASALGARPGQSDATAVQVTSGNHSIEVGGRAGTNAIEPRPVDSSLGAGRARVTGPGVVFNPETGRYENSPNMEPASTNGQAAAANRQAATGAAQNTREFRGAPSPGSLGRSAAPAFSAPGNMRDAAAPAGRPAWGAQESAAPSASPSHSVAPSYRPSTSSNSGSWGGSHSGYSGSSGSGWGRSGGGASSGGGGSWGSSSGSSHSGGGSSGGSSMGSSGGGGGGHSGGSSSSSSGSPHK